LTSVVCAQRPVAPRTIKTKIALRIGNLDWLTFRKSMLSLRSKKVLWRGLIFPLAVMKAKQGKQEAGWCGPPHEIQQPSHSSLRVIRFKGLLLLNFCLVLVFFVLLVMIILLAVIILLPVIIVAMSITVFAHVVPLQACFSRHESRWIFSYLLAHFRVFLQEGAQISMFFHELRVIDQRRIWLQLLGDFRMSIQEPVEVGELLTGNIRAGVTWAVFVVLEALLALHEKARGFLNLFAHPRMAGQEGPQIRMVFHPLRVVDQRRVSLKLLGDLRMSIQIGVADVGFMIE